MRAGVAVLAVAISGVPALNYTRCPSPHEIQARGMANFSLDAIAGHYMELAFHDYTQYPLCPFKPRCIQSSKAVSMHPDGTQFVNDTFDLSCDGKYYPQTLLFNATDIPGFLTGYVPVTRIPFLPKDVVRGMKFPDTVVDFRPGPRGWALEFQCVELLGRVVFIGVNFYARAKDEALLHEMRAAAAASGIDFYFQSGGLTRVDQEDCARPDRAAEPAQAAQVGRAAQAAQPALVLV